VWDLDDETASNVLGAWLARWRRQAGVSQRSLAARAGVDQGGLSRVERGLETLGSRRLARVVVALDEICQQGPMGPMPPPPVLIRAPRTKDNDGGGQLGPSDDQAPVDGR